ncbi:MAG: tRNA-intron lyase [Candidatus Odinarchaeota archaeon]
MSDENNIPPNQEDYDEDNDYVIEEEELSEPEEEPAEVIFESGKGYVASEDADRLSQQGFYGTRIEGNRLELEPVELLHLIERKRITVKTPSGTSVGSDYIVSELLEEDPDLWVSYLVFRDLRSRGYAVRKGFGRGIGFRVYARGDRPGAANAKELVYVLKEGVPISLSDLDLVTQTAVSSRKNLVFALVDQNGEVNFYKVAQSTLRNRSGDE